MSIQKINDYYKKVKEIQLFSGLNKETSIRRQFAELISYYAAKKTLILVDEYPIKNTKKVADGGLLDENRSIHGYWEAKDLEDDLEKEIIKKINIGYPTFNILFENSEIAILYQNDIQEKCDIKDAKALDKLLIKFVNYETQQAREFKEALAMFSRDVPKIIEVLRKVIANLLKKEQNIEYKNTSTYNQEFVDKRKIFYEICQSCINPNIKYFDVDEMIIQHILTQDIFRNVFADNQFHEENNIAMSLIDIEKTFFIGDFKREITNKMKGYYAAIKEHSANLPAHQEKQNFLKKLYEEFYKAYNPKTADKLGIVYTPSQVVKFMLKTTDYLLEKHFNKNLIDSNVHILDPATGTGTFVTDLLEYLPHNDMKKFEYKYKNEIHANEVAILPYYIAYLNIEYTYQNKTKTYRGFDNLCWVDTLDNIDALNYKNKQSSLAGMVNAENYKRIQDQNSKKISIIIGNPPYNANQQNENDDNKNREYKEIDKRIKDTYIKYSTAQKTKQYDMYKRFFRWASDRMTDNGIIAFITNRAFINSGQDDGFRKCIKEEFDEVHIVDLKGDIRANDTSQGGNVFNIMAGVAISFLIKKQTNKPKKDGQIFYYNVGDNLTGKEKLDILYDNDLENLIQERIRPDKKNNWINLSESDFDELIPLISKEEKDQEVEQDENIAYKVSKEEQGSLVVKEQIFNSSNIGVNTARDEWVFDFDKENLLKKSKFFVETYNAFLNKHLKKNAKKMQENYEKMKLAGKKVAKPQLVNQPLEWDISIKWSRDLKIKFMRAIFLKLNKDRITTVHYRPFVKKLYYAEKPMSDVLTSKHYVIFGENLDKENILICTSVGDRLPFSVFCVNILPTFQFYVDPATCFPLYVYNEKGEKVDNITDWALELFQKKYKNVNIQKIDIFHYIYGVLHSENYRKKYELDLKRNFPRIPLYIDFEKYANVGKELLNLHLNYQNINTKNILKIDINHQPLESLLPKRKNTNQEEDALLLKKIQPEIKLKVKDGIIEIDALTTISNIPAEVWAYKLGNKTAIDWVLDQYKPYKSTDKSIQEKFNTYNFFDFKEEIITLLKQVMYVSMETIRIIKMIDEIK